MKTRFRKITNSTVYRTRDMVRLAERLYPAGGRFPSWQAWFPFPQRLAIRYRTVRGYMETTAEMPFSTSPEGRRWGAFLKPGDPMYVDAIFWRREVKSSDAPGPLASKHSRLSISIARPSALMGQAPMEKMAAATLDTLPPHVMKQLSQAFRLAYQYPMGQGIPAIYMTPIHIDRKES